MKLTKTQIILLFSCFVAFLLFSFLIFTVWLPQSQQTDQMIFSWPDATANYFFTKQVANYSRLTALEPLNQVLDNEVIRMRSINVIGENLVPMGFLGLPVIYGLISKIIGLNLILFLTPLLAVLIAVFFYLILKRIFDKKIALLSSILTLILPPFIYYSSLPFLNSILFLFLTITGIFCLIRLTERKKLGYAFLAGLLFSLAFFTRMVEVYWLFFIVLILFITYRKKIKFSHIFVFLFSCSFVLLLILYLNEQIYGHWSHFGYLRLNDSKSLLDKLPTEFQIATSSKFKEIVSFIFIPFGWHGKVVLKNISTYLIKMLWPIFILSSCGITLFVKKWKKQNKAKKTYFWIFIITSFWLIFYYGNWEFIDPHVLNYNRISSSYARYWLPIYILMLPFISYFIFESCKVIKLKVKSKTIVIINLILIILMGFFSYKTVYKNQYDGLLPLKQHLNEYYDRFKKVINITEKNSIIITDRTDKIFFPKRKVVVLLDDFSVFKTLNKIVKDIPIYYFSTRPSDHIETIKARELEKLGLTLELVKEIDPVYYLFKLKNN